MCARTPVRCNSRAHLCAMGRSSERRGCSHSSQRWSARPWLCLSTNVSESSQSREIPRDCVWLFLLYLPVMRTSTRAGRAALHCQPQTCSSHEAQVDALCCEPGSWNEVPHPSCSPRHSLSVAVPDEQPGNPWRCRGAPVTTNICNMGAGTQQLGLPLSTARSGTAGSWAARRHGALGGRSSTGSWHWGGGCPRPRAHWAPSMGCPVVGERQKELVSPLHTGQTAPSPRAWQVRGF